MSTLFELYKENYRENNIIFIGVFHSNGIKKN